MPAPALELQKAVFAALTSDASILALLGGPRVYDQSPAVATFPYVTFGRTSLYDWSTGTESGSEQIFTLHVWSKGRGKKETLEVMDRIGAILSDPAFALDGHRLVNLRLEFSDARFDDDLTVTHGTMRFRAVTEPL